MEWYKYDENDPICTDRDGNPIVWVNSDNWITVTGTDAPRIAKDIAATHNYGFFADFIAFTTIFILVNAAWSCLRIALKARKEVSDGQKH